MVQGGNRGCTRRPSHKRALVGKYMDRYYWDKLLIDYTEYDVHTMLDNTSLFNFKFSQTVRVGERTNLFTREISVENLVLVWVRDWRMLCWELWSTGLQGDFWVIALPSWRNQYYHEVPLTNPMEIHPEMIFQLTFFVTLVLKSFFLIQFTHFAVKTSIYALTWPVGIRPVDSSPSGLFSPIACEHFAVSTPWSLLQSPHGNPTPRHPPHSPSMWHALIQLKHTINNL